MKIIDTEHKTKYEVKEILDSKFSLTSVNGKETVKYSFDVVVDKDVSGLKCGDVVLVEDHNFSERLSVKNIDYGKKLLKLSYYAKSKNKEEHDCKLDNDCDIDCCNCKCGSEKKEHDDGVNVFKSDNLGDIIKELGGSKPKHVFLAVSDGKKVTDVLEFKDGDLEAYSMSKCHDEDEFDFRQGVQVALDRLCGKEIKNPKVKTPFKYLLSGEPVYEGEPLVVLSNGCIMFGKLQMTIEGTYDVVDVNGIPVGEVLAEQQNVFLKGM